MTKCAQLLNLEKRLFVPEVIVTAEQWIAAPSEAMPAVCADVQMIRLPRWVGSLVPKSVHNIEGKQCF